MEEKDKNFADKVLKHLCIGSRIDGIRFGPVPQLLITDHDSECYKDIKGQVYLNLASKWCLYPKMPEQFPQTEDEITELNEEEELQLLCSIRLEKIENIHLDVDLPHLIIKFESGKVFFLYGFDKDYESWDLGVAFSGSMENWLVVAIPGGEVGVFCPERFV
jgi:hypothetical protein